MVQHATTEAQRLKHQFIGAEHLLLALVDLADSPVSKMLIEAGLTPQLVHEEMVKLPMPPYEFIGKLPFTPRARRVLEQAEFNARKLGSPRVDDVHVLMALLAESGGKPKEWFTKFAIRVDTLKERAFAEITRCK